MDIYDTKTAQTFITSWSSHGRRGRWMMRHAAKSQRSCAELARQMGYPNTAQAHMAAAELLETAGNRELIAA